MQARNSIIVNKLILNLDGKHNKHAVAFQRKGKLKSKKLNMLKYNSVKNKDKWGSRAAKKNPLV